jgi:formate C-acetyltransferase
MEINVRDFIQKNYTEYTGDESFLCGPTIRTLVLWEQCKELLKQEKENDGVLDIDTTTFSGINNFAPGYIDKHQELIVGLQTDAPLKRIVNPYGGMRMVEASLKAYNRELDGDLKEHFNEFRKTHNQGVFDVYTPEMRLARHTGLLTGLPDAYGRDRIIGDYRRVALYGIDALIDEKRKDWEALTGEMLEDTIKLREEVAEQIRALKEIKLMAERYDYPEIASPAKNCQ